MESVPKRKGVSASALILMDENWVVMSPFCCDGNPTIFYWVVEENEWNRFLSGEIEFPDKFRTFLNAEEAEEYRDRKSREVKEDYV